MLPFLQDRLLSVDPQGPEIALTPLRFIAGIGALMKSSFFPISTLRLDQLKCRAKRRNCSRCQTPTRLSTDYFGAPAADAGAGFPGNITEAVFNLVWDAQVESTAAVDRLWEVAGVADWLADRS